MSRDPPMVPDCLFRSKFISRTKRPPTDLDLIITLEGSRPQIIHFSVDADSQGYNYISFSQGHYFIKFHDKRTK